MTNNNSLEIQCELLGGYMKNPDIFSQVENLVRPNIFTTPVTKTSYEVIKAYHDKGVELDVTSLYGILIKKGVPKEECAVVASFLGRGFLHPKLVEEYVTELFTEYVGRYLYPIMQSATKSANPLTAMTTVKDAITNVELALNNVSKDKSVKLQFKETMKRIKDLKSGEKAQTGFSWGLPSLDKKTMGIVQGINVVAGDKGAGKTSLVINIIRHNAIKLQTPVLFFSMEMTAIEVLTNLIANIKRINSRALRTGQVDDTEMVDIENLENVINDNLVIDETGGISWTYFEAKVRAHRKKQKIPASETMLVILDYLGLMKNPPEEGRMSKEEKVEQTCTELMRICKNENIALVKLAQFSRESSKRANDTFNVKTNEDRLRALRPKMTDLKGSSAIESNAVTIVLLFRPSYYDINDSDGRDLRGLCELNIAKGRYVSPSPIYVKFKGEYNLFEDLAADDNDIKTQGDGDAF